MHQVSYNPPENSYHLGYESDYQEYLHPLPQFVEKAGQEEKTLGKAAESGTAKQSWKITPERQKEFIEAKNRLNELVNDPDISSLAAAQIYMEEWPDLPAEPLRRSPRDERQIAWRKFNKDTRPAERLFGSLDRPTLYNLHAVHLGLPDLYSHVENFPMHSYDKELLRDVWTEAIEQHIEPPYFYKLENASRFHCHVIASHNAGLNHIPRGGEVIEIIEPGDEIRVLGYLYKPFAIYDEMNLAMWIHAKKERLFTKGMSRYLPKACGYVGLESVKRWNA